MKLNFVDVSGLPTSAMDHRSPIWWGNLLMLFVESTMFAILFAGYAYVSQNFEHWPPPQTNRFPVLYDPVPALGPASVLLALILVSVVPAVWASRAGLRMDEHVVRRCMTVLCVMGVGIIWLEYHTLSTSLHVKWSDNAYASFLWAIVGMHFFHSVVATGENVVLTSWLWARGMDSKHARDVRVSSVYWYWLAGMWVIIYGVAFWSPRFI